MDITLIAADSASSGPPGYLFVLYFLQLAFGALVFATNPKRKDLPEVAQRARSGAIWAGLIPCFGFMLFVQIAFLIIYRTQLGQIGRFDRAQEARLRQMDADREPGLGSGGSSGVNPFL